MILRRFFAENLFGGMQKEECKGEECNRRNVKGGVQGEMQEVECIPEKETANASKHARWPAATCGYSKLPTAKFRTWPGGEAYMQGQFSMSEVSAICCACFVERVLEGMIFDKRIEPKL